MKPTIIYADDSREYLDLVTLFLKREPFILLTTESGDGALELLRVHPETSLVILDVMMGPPDGWETCRLVRAESDVPVLMLTALGTERNEIYGLDNGADDYIAKPFGRARLVSRINALIRRRNRDEQKQETIISVGPVVFDGSARRVTVDGEEVALSPREFSLLYTFVANVGIVMKREVLLDRVWGLDYEGDSRTLDTHVKSLRAKLGKAGALIKTIHGIGYRLSAEADVTQN